MKTVISGLVSVIVPAYNAGKYLPETIRSVLGQTYQKWELILVDDGSTDNTREVMKPFLTDARIRYVYKQNAGVSSARNRGLEDACGQYIGFLDADDVWLPENLAKKIQVLNDSTADWVFSNMFLGDAALNIIKPGPSGTDKEILKHLLLWDRETIPTVCSNVVFTRKCFETGLRFDNSFSTAADQDFAFNLASAFKGKLIPENLYVYRILPDSMSRNIQNLQTDHLAVYRKALKNGLFPGILFQKKCFSNLYLILAGNWWSNGKNKPRSIWFLFLSICTYPPVLFKMAKKVYR